MDLKQLIYTGKDYSTFYIDVEQLNKHSKKKGIAFAPKVKWNQVHTLVLIGTGVIPKLEKMCYVDPENESWVLLVGLASSKIPEYINQKCSRSLNHLTIAWTDINELHFTLRPYLRELCLINNQNLHFVSGLDQLIGLLKLRIQCEKLDSELNLSNMQLLEELVVHSADPIVIQTERPMKNLKKLDLGGKETDNISFIRQCPALEHEKVSSKSLSNKPIKKPPEQDNQNEEHQLLKTILQVCGQIQREPDCWGTKEDVRNRRMRDALEIAKYDVHDQTQLGISSSKKDVGELDLMLYRGNQIPWSIIEALRIYDGSKGDWNTHLEKVLDNYNPHGVPFLFLVTYADCEKKRFDGIWEGYMHHIQNHNSGDFAYVDQSYELLTGLLNNHYIQIAKTRYRCGDYTPTVYHIFVQMNPKRGVTTE